jgi:hypothetical protein
MFNIEFIAAPTRVEDVIGQAVFKTCVLDHHHHEITAGEGELELQSAGLGGDFVLSFKRETAGVVREFEARGQRAGGVTVDAENMIPREVRAP